MNFSNKLTLKDWNWRTPITDILNLEENKLVYKKNIIYEGQTSPRYSHTTIHEMGEMKRAPELRVDKFSVQKMRDNHETIQRLTSQMQEMQEQMNFMNDSCEFQEAELHHSGRLSHVPSQPAPIPSSCSMLSSEKRLPLDTWNTSEPQENVFGNQFSTIDSSRNLHQRIHPSMTPGDTGSVPVHTGTRTPVARDEDLNFNADIWKKTVDHRFIICSGHSVEFYGWTAKTTDIGTAIRQIPYTFLFSMLEDKIQKPSDCIGGYHPGQKNYRLSR